LFCKYCAFFATAAIAGSHKHVPLEKFVTKPLTVFAKLLGKDGDINMHEKLDYHRHAVEAGKEFLKTYYAPEHDIINRVNTQRLEQVQENRQRLKPIIETLVFLGRQNIALRGHRDDGDLVLDSSRGQDESLSNEGNF
jgi:hypothetical protein